MLSVTITQKRKTRFEIYACAVNFIFFAPFAPRASAVRTSTIVSETLRYRSGNHGCG
jgi:hypothetical protein